MKKSELEYINKFANLDYETFKQMATDPSLHPNEKVGFPYAYREGKEPLIYNDICTKANNLNKTNQLILDIGPGCSALPLLLLEQAQQNNSKVIFCDSKEMLSQLPDREHVTKIEGPFPHCWPAFKQYLEAIDIIIVYSVFHYIFGKEEKYLFLDRCLDLLAHGGQLLIGDLPNFSKRTRFFQSPAGIAFHQKYTNSNELPDMSESSADNKQFDDALIIDMIQYAHHRGYNAYLMPQVDGLPMANRREDILVIRP